MADRRRVRAAAVAVLGWSFALALLAPASVRAACVVLDPELQAGYSGGCVDGHAEGRGEARGTAEYAGEFRAGRKYGRGVKIWPATGDRYEGDFVADRKEGSGTYTWGPRSGWAGEKYSGAYRNDSRDGHGVYLWPDGARYEGAWTNDVATGALTPPLQARARAYGELAPVAGQPGATVCRQMQTGDVVREWLRGSVLAADAGTITVRIDNAGRLPNVIANQVVARGDVVRDALNLWTPCR